MIRKHFLLLLCMLLSLSSCGLFDTREPELPTTGTGFIWTEATSIDYLLDNFEKSFEVMDADNHKRVFISSTDSVIQSGQVSYIFFHSTSLDPGSRPVFDGWDVEHERDYVFKLKNLLRKDARLTLMLTDRETEQSNPYQASVRANYTISFPAESNGILPSNANGSIILQMRQVKTERDAQEWRITNWTDLDPQDPEAFTWSDLKAKAYTL